MLKSIKARRTARIEKELRVMLSSPYAILQRLYNEYKRGLPIPMVADVGLSPSVHAIITDEQTIVIRQTFEDINLTQTLPSIVSDWKVRLDDKLVRMVQAKLSEPFTKDRLLLPITVFYCDACNQVLVHTCSRP